MAGSSLVRGGVVVVTGASSGIGAAFVRAVAHEARVVVLVARRTERLLALQEELAGAPATLEAWTADLAQPGAVDALAEHLLGTFGSVDVLVNNAGLGDGGLFECADPDKLDAVVQVNVLALTRLTRLLLPAMVARRRGGLLFVSSGYGLVWMPGMSVYIATKHYVTALSDALRCELQGTGVVVSQLCPGPVATEFEQVAFAGKAPRVPGFVQISAEDCARHGLRGLARSRALVVPGWKHQLLIGSYRLLPRPIMRLVGRVLGWALRRMQTVPPVLSPGDSGSRPS